MSFHGYSLHQSAYLYLDVHTHKIYTSCHVRFVETQFHFSNSTSIPDSTCPLPSWTLPSSSFPIASLSSTLHPAPAHHLLIASTSPLTWPSIAAMPTLSMGSGTSQSSSPPISVSFSPLSPIPTVDPYPIRGPTRLAFK